MGESNFTTTIYARKQLKEEEKQKKTRTAKGFLYGGLAGGAAGIALVIAAPAAVFAVTTYALIGSVAYSATTIGGGALIGKYIAG